MIPKKIHYVWFGGPKGNIENICINSWKEKLPEYEIVEWNEKNFDIEKEIKGNKFLEECYKRKLWAFISDYTRIRVLYEQGGVYMDTDMQILKDITPLLENNRLICGYEDDGEYMNAAIVGVEKGHPFFKDLLEYYEKEVLTSSLFTIPKVMTYLMEKNYKKIDQNNYEEGIRVYDKEYFYPFGFKEDFTPECITENTYGIHWWGKSWAKKRNYFLESKHLTGVNKIWKCCKIFASNTLRS
ncbi:MULTISPECIES: glycosyltransferase [unclassified Clostridioides]|uniref:glycosyltransferase n=1 Tax=unclassified Clostridioides TaxID=2635829 RepID=UPI001D0F7387|nr:glycosyltransferase [Clostridioides sp. ZZV14-6150]MCC0646903.1 glycosyltransferase [Clostridioides sp. ZZV15-6598]MCC0660883.1 glycosyltransferase [Clostridioides sp. ZZV14-6154]MCC0667956.1 glycosyltransferase [Clostridioides sp. ZZV14-6153]MCC0717516.1 glycosyltransferase [Clostridioides sp. ZZV14-6105]MCC0721355.1 glycosyltransferase [Clostridioides sp. ZZV14-6104]MCC0725530.1 glycosyltransferase [Clostridioides sp. ZZV14-6045]MCC0729645.1 glycosyltransferase [Clostridioides sp. ZZV14